MAVPIRSGRANRASMTSAGKAINSLATSACSIGFPFSVQADPLRQERVRAVGDDHAMREKLALGVAGGDADDRTILPKEIDHGEFRVNLGSGLLGLLAYHRSNGERRTE